MECNELETLEELEEVIHEELLVMTVKKGKSIKANSWPGSFRGFGPITRKLDGEV